MPVGKPVPTVSAVLDLGPTTAAFSQGGNRLCFVDPRERSRCIKVLRPDRSPQRKRAERGFPKNLKPLSRFDDNREEFAVYRRIARTVGADAYALIPRLHGWEQTNLGAGLSFDLVRDHDGRVAVTLKQYLWQHGRSALLEQALAQFRQRWGALGMPSRKLLTHNIVVQCGPAGPDRLWVIDGLGWPDLLPLAYGVPALARRKARRKLRTLERAMDALLTRREQAQAFGYHGWLDDTQRRH